jgi:hypothetical protein
LVVAVLAWKLVLAPPAPAGFIPKSKEEVKQMQIKHAQSVQEMQAKQQQLFQQAHGGGQ